MEANPLYYQQSQAQPQLQGAGVGIRFLALLIDSIIVGIIAAILGIIFRLLLGPNAGPAIGGSLGFVVFVIYYFGLEATQGATFGKRALGLRVVKTDGSPIGWTESIVRNLLRIIDGLFGYLVGAILVWTSPLHQRLGDRLANTIVVRRQA